MNISTVNTRFTTMLLVGIAGFAEVAKEAYPDCEKFLHCLPRSILNGPCRYRVGFVSCKLLETVIV